MLWPGLSVPFEGVCKSAASFELILPWRVSVPLSLAAFLDSFFGFSALAALGLLALTFLGSDLAFLAFACFFGDLETLAFLVDLGMSAKDFRKWLAPKIRAGDPDLGKKVAEYRE